MDELAHRTFPAACLRVGAAGKIPIKIFRHGDFGRQFAPFLGDLDVFLAENRFGRAVGDLCGAEFPFDILERIDFRGAEEGFKYKAASGLGDGRGHAAG